MSRRAICKFYCTGVEELEELAGVDARTVRLTTHYDPNSAEDTSFSQFTPWGNMEFGVDNPALNGFFKPGE